MASSTPVHSLFQVLERIRAAKPRIEHAVSENEVRSRGTTKCPPGRETRILPDIMRDHAIKPTDVRAKPGNERSRIMILAHGWPKRMDFQAGIVHSRAARTIETGDLDRMPHP